MKTPPSTGRPHSPEVPGVEGEKGNERDPDAEDVHRFQDLLRKETPASQKEKERAKHGQGPEENSREQSPGGWMLSILQSAPESEVPPSPRAAELGELGQRLAKRILVSAPRLDALPQVRIHLKEGVLPQTEIVLKRRDNGLEIHFQTSDATALQTLQTHLDGLQQTLEARLGDQGTVRILVKQTSSEEGMPRDGRSRNRRRYDDDDR